MRICNATGNGVCVGCGEVPPMINGYRCGDICRHTAQKVIDVLSGGDVVVYNSDDGKFYRKVLFTDTAIFIGDPEDDWEEI